MAVVELADPLGDPAQRLGWGEAVRAAGVDPGVDLVVHAGDADHEELVEVGDEDGEELHPLHQRQRLVAGELEDAVVELEPGQLAVDVQRRVGRAPAGSAPVSLGVDGALGHRFAVPHAGDRRQLDGTQQHDQLTLLDRGQPALGHPGLGAGEVVEGHRERGIMTDEQHVLQTRGQPADIERLAGERRLERGLDVERLAGELRGLPGADLGRGEAELELDAQPGQRPPGGLGLRAPAPGQRALVVGHPVGSLGMAQQPEHRA